jgi:hypothetical protein
MWEALSPLEMRTAGPIPNWIEKIGVDQRLVCPAIVVKRSVYERLGGFHPLLVFSLDWEMWRRVAAFYPVWYEPAPLACWRRRTGSGSEYWSDRLDRWRDARSGLELTRSYLPADVADRFTEGALRLLAKRAVWRGGQALDRGRLGYAASVFREALRCSNSPRTWLQILDVMALWPVRALRRAGAMAARAPR